VIAVNAIKSKFNSLYAKAQLKKHEIKTKIFDTSGEGQIDTAVKIIIGVVIGALVLGGLVLLWNGVIMPRLNTEVNSMFGGSGNGGG
jgi:hypothetical protein